MKIRPATTTDWDCKRDHERRFRRRSCALEIKMQTDVRFLRPLIEDALRNSDRYDWSLQGFGMLRAYVGPESNPSKFRLNVWSQRFAVPEVSTIHDHPWHFESVIVAGAFCNVRYTENKNRVGYTHDSMLIIPGPDGGPVKQAVESTHLTAQTPELYSVGDVYCQFADEIHQSIPYEGTVTLNDRTRTGGEDRARVFWKHGQKWVDAKPRPATREEARLICRDSLARWFNG